MQQILLVLSLSGLALCGSLSNEYLPANVGVISKSGHGAFGGAISSYSPTSRFSSGGNVFGASSIPTPQYGVPGAPGAVKTQLGGQYPSVSQYSKSSAPGALYGAPSQSLGVSSFAPSPLSSGSQFKSQTFPSSQYGAPFRSSGPSSFGPSASFSSGPQYKQALPSAQYGAPSAFGQQQSIGVSSFPIPTQYSSQAAPSHGISSQYGAPRPAAQFGHPTASFRSGPQFGGVSSSQGISSATPYSGTVQDGNGAYFY